MNEQLAQLIATRLGNGANGADPAAWASALSQHGADPLTAMLMSQMLAARPHEPVEAASDDDERDREVERLRRALGRARQELASADVMARYVAETFGACPKCWGLNHLCPHCGGKGGPGYAEPDAETLRAWVEPALAKAGFAIVATT